MFLGVERFIAGRYLRSKRKEVFISIITIISVLGVAISVMVLDVVLGVMTGFEAELREKLIGASAHVVVRHVQGNIEEWEGLTKKILTVSGVKSAVPYTHNQAMLTGNGVATGILIRGVAELEEPVEKLKKSLSPETHIEDLFVPAEISITRPDGTPDTVSLPPILIGRTLQQRLAAPRGTVITLLSPQMTSSPQGLIPRSRRFALIGNYSSGLIEYESGLAYTSLKDSQQFFGMGRTVTGIEVEVDDLFQAQAIAARIESALGKDSPYSATDWTQPNKPLWEAMQLEKRVYFIVLLLLVLVASFSIVSTLVMVVMEKNKDIAILKTMGASDRLVMRVFLLQGSIIGFSGTLLGTLLGVVGCLLLREYGFEIDERVFSLSKVPVHLVPSNFVMVAVSGLLITACAGIYPALRAAHLKPADALRYE